jgi:protein-disulfide isomerase
MALRNPLVLLLLVAPAFFACGDGEGAVRDAAAEAANLRNPSTTTAVVEQAARIEAGYRMGAADAPLAVVEFSDFGCPYCGRFALGTFPELKREYLDRGLVRWRYVPVSFGFAGGAIMGAGAVCAGQLAGPEGFWRAHDVLYRNQGALRGADAYERMLDRLAETGLDRGRLAACVQSPSTAATLEANNEVAAQWLVRGTPTFLINGVPMSGALPTEFFRKVLDTALDPSGL